MAEKYILGIADYVIIVIMLVMSTLIGLYFRMFGGKQKTNNEYLLAGRDMSIFPVSFSLMATFMAATTLMGIPAEMYLFGTNMAFMNIGFLLGPVIASFVFLPIYFETGVSTAYEYLLKRFGESTRRILSGIFIFHFILFNGVVLYAPALALSAVTNLSMWAAIISTGVVCTFYCTMGGMKAVLWTDVFQSFLMYTCLLAITIIGCINLGGFENIFKSAYDGGRILLPSFEFDFSRRYTMWSVFLQGLIITLHGYGICQVQIQRQLTLKNLKRSQIASILSAPLVMIFQLFCCLCGLIFYVNFKSCDPMTSPAKPLTSADQLMPYYITSAMGQYPGLPGLCIAGIFSASLSTISSSVNSMAAVTYEDIIRPLWPRVTYSVLITKVASVFYGVLCIVFSYFAASMGNLVKAAVMVTGIVAGPTLGLYLLATLTTTTNKMGADIGIIASFVLAGYLTFITSSRHYPQLPVQSNCSEPLNFTTVFSTTKVAINISEPIMSTTDAEDNFPVSYMWISPLSLVVCMIVGYLASCLVSFFRGKSENVPPELLSPVRRWFIKDVIKDEKKTAEIIEVKDLSITRF